MLEKHELLNKFSEISKQNIARNIIKAFFTYLIDVKHNDLLTDFVAHSQNDKGNPRNIAKNYFKNMQFNNNSLRKLIDHPKYGKAFEFYLTFEAETWLANSRVRNRQDHLIFIDFMKLCCSNTLFSK